MAGVSIEEAVDKLEASTVAKRTEGLNDLRRLLTRPESAAKLQRMRNDAWHKILTILFNHVVHDKHDFLGGSATAKTRAANRLKTIASALRHVVQFSASLVRHKTAYAVLDHIVDCLNFEEEHEEGFRSLIQHEYFQAFHDVLANASHGEHLRPENWLKYVDFALSAVNAILDDIDADEQEEAASEPRAYSITSSIRGNMPSRGTQASSDGSLSGSKGFEELVTALKNLTSITNSPLASKAGEIAQTSLRMLEQSSLQAKEVAFQSLNNVLALAITRDLVLASYVADRVMLIIKHKWSSKSDPKSMILREQMLLTLYHIRHMFDSYQSIGQNVDYKHIQSLLDKLRGEYERRGPQDILQLSDLSFSRSSKNDFFQRSGISPLQQSEAAIQNYTLVAVLGALLQALASRSSRSSSLRTDKEFSDTSSRKRVRQDTTVVALELACESMETKGQSSVCGLQIALLSINNCHVDATQAQATLDLLTMNLSDDPSPRSSWILLVLSSLLTIWNAEAIPQPCWQRLWVAASNLITSKPHSRAACFVVMRMIAYGLADAFSSPVELSAICFRSGSLGPPALSDSALMLFSSCLRSRLLLNERTMEDFQQKVIGWLDAMWSLPSQRNLAHNLEVSRMGQPFVLYELLGTMAGMTAVTTMQRSTSGRNILYNAYLLEARTSGFIQFLNLEEPVMVETTARAKDPNLERVPMRAKTVDIAVSEFLCKKLEAFHDAYRSISSTGNTRDANGSSQQKQRANLSIDIVEIICTACSVSCLLFDSSSNLDLQAVIWKCWSCVLDFIGLQSNEGPAFEASCSCLAKKLLVIQATNEHEQLTLARRRLELVKSLKTAIDKQADSQYPGDIMDVEFPVRSTGSQQDQDRTLRTHQSAARRDTAVLWDDHSVFVEMKGLLLQESLSADLSQADQLATAMTDHFVEMSPEDLIDSRTVLTGFINDNGAYSASDAARLLRRIAELCLQADENERNEAALCLCLRAMKGLVYLWTHSEDEDLSEVAFDIYDWYIKTALGKGIASLEVLYSLTLVLQDLLQYKPRYGTDGGLPSPRTSLLQILKSGPPDLKFRITPTLLKLFEGYILTEHAAIFDDIVDCLPTDSGDREGIAVRLYIIARLGSTWRTVLRQAVYHIFETVANVPSATLLAKQAIEMMARDVGLGKDAPRLLHLFAPQVFFTWLEEGAIETIPFAAFGYSTLRELVLAEEQELVAQTVLRQHFRQKQSLENMIGKSWSALVQEHFALAHVYAIATDVVDNRAGGDVGPVEQSTRHELGEDKYSALAQQHCADEVAYLILSLSDDRGLDKLLSNSSHHKSEAQAFENILARGASKTTHPVRQQPSFRARYLLHLLSKLGLSANIDQASLWTPALLTHVCRKLFDDADDALGPLHIASMIRKVRIAIALAGPIALQGYPLEMLLHNLRPYLTNFHCTEDAIGVYWYLLEQSHKYLTGSPSFLAGLGISIFASLSTFAMSSQESTTQESQFVSTMSKAREFRKWLAQYLDGFHISMSDTGKAARFEAIIKHAKDMANTGTNNHSEPEGLLLYQILVDQTEDEALIPDAFFKLIVSELSNNFRLASDPADDIFYGKDSVITCAPVVWRVLKDKSTSTAFQTWIGKVLGAAYVRQGPTLACTAPSAPQNTFRTDKSLEPNDSRRKLLCNIVEMLWAGDTPAASKAEITLSWILSSLPQDDRKALIYTSKDRKILEDLVFPSDQCPQPRLHDSQDANADAISDVASHPDYQVWSSLIAEFLIVQYSVDSFLNRLLPLLQEQHAFTVSALPMIVHIILDSQISSPHGARETISKCFDTILHAGDICRGHALVVLDVVLYLRRCVYPRETNHAKRNSWLAVDYALVAAVASKCGMPHTALLMMEIEQSEHALQSMRSKRSSVSAKSVNTEMLTTVFRNVDDEDFFYAGHQERSIEAVLEKLQHERKDHQALALQSALFDSNIKALGAKAAFKSDGTGIVSALALANLHGLAFATQQYVGSSHSNDVLACRADSALNIHQWDVTTNEQDSKIEEALSSAMRTLETVQSSEEMYLAFDAATSTITSQLLPGTKATDMVGLAALSHVQELAQAVLHADDCKSFDAPPKSLEWAAKDKFETVTTILAAREASLAAMRRNETSNGLFRGTEPNLIMQEIHAVRQSLYIGNTHEAAQFCLNKGAYLSQLRNASASLGVDIESAVTFDIANTLWSQGEITAPIEMLRGLQSAPSLGKGPISISRAELLTDLGQKLSKARLSRADEVTQDYLQPAIDALENKARGTLAGRVYHNFATFCDEQLQDSSSRDDFNRIAKLRDRKEQEVDELAVRYKQASGRERDTWKQAYSKAKTWFSLDDEEYKRLKANRDLLLRQCLENYLLSMQACDDFSKDVLRLVSLWLGNTIIADANESVRNHLESVPTMKLAPFVNQLSSRLMDSQDAEGFQRVLHSLLFRICVDHPFHSLYQLFAVSKSKGAKGDTIAESRHAAATKIAEKVQRSGNKSSSSIWIAIHNSNIGFVQFAQDKPRDDLKSGTKHEVRRFQYGRKLLDVVQGQKKSRPIPPPTMKIAIRPDKEYGSIPTMDVMEPHITIAGGVSAPKIATIIATDGSRHKMLLKGGNDDLRQDAIMEQVFEQVSTLLRDHRPTRQRNIEIRTYKVVPLTHNAGVIEFVQNTIPLHEYLLPAHQRYYPKDLKPNAARRAISDVQAKSTKDRVKTYLHVCTQFHPVMRFFYMEHFLDPDEWFQKRLNYSRSSAAISILGHVLGLGDRHGHNILLDEKTGEVVHIDLGVAFEAGRVLPVPELIPFRLTRDLVDGMGLSGVEGPFRRCCNFTLEALRKDQDVIMTILDVLRWDPLYSWSVSPLRVKRMQDQKEREDAAAKAAGRSETTSEMGVGDGADARSRRGTPLEQDGLAAAAAGGEGLNRADEPGEADRALATVAKKLSKSLSVEATVNELIRQATDEENLALLYCGWAAYA